MISYSFNLIVFFMYPHITNKLPKTIIGEQFFNPNLASENVLAVEFQLTVCGLGDQHHAVMQPGKSKEYYKLTNIQTWT